MNNINQYSFVYGLAVFAGFSYLTGFWMPFQFNFIEYIDLSGVIKISAFSLIPVLVSMLIGAGLGSLGASFAISAKSHAITNTSTEEKNKSSLIDKTFAYITTGVFVLTIAVSIPFLLSGNINEKLLGAYPIASLIAVRYFSRRATFLDSIVPTVRAIVITVVCLLPSFAILMGYAQGLDALHDDSRGYLIYGTEHCSSSDSEKFRYLSTSGEKILTYSVKDGSICITSSNYLKLVPHNVVPSSNSNGISHLIKKYKTLPPLKYFLQ